MATIRLKRKNYTIQEGHYSGPKDLESVPGALEVVGKTTAAGTVIGGVVGRALPDSSVWSGAKTGGTIGLLGGIAGKVLLNYLHNPMKSVKFQEVDKNLRREFGIYQMAGVTIGDSLPARTKFDDMFSFNDRSVTDYKINIVISDNQVILYTLGVTDKDLSDLNQSLDYYCKKYSGMSYRSHPINYKVNSYSVNITFTNHSAISGFILEISEKLKTKINLLDNKFMVDRGVSGSSGRELKWKNDYTGKYTAQKDVEEDVEEKEYSDKLKFYNRNDITRIVSRALGNVVISNPFRFGFGMAGTMGIMTAVTEAMKKLENDENSMNPGKSVTIGDLGNHFLEGTLKKLHYSKGKHYVIGDKNCPCQISIVFGKLIVTVPKGGTESEKTDSKFWKPLRTKVMKVENKDAEVYFYDIESRSEFELVLNKLMSTGLTFNIYDK